MSTMSIDQVLAQIRTLRAEAQGVKPPVEADNTSFGALLKNSIEHVNNTQQTSSDLQTRFEKGEAGLDLAQVMIASQKANIEFQAMVQVRNKLVEAYKDIMNMPI